MVEEEEVDDMIVQEYNQSFTNYEKNGRTVGGSNVAPAGMVKDFCNVNDTLESCNDEKCVFK